ncbi:Transmembrane component NikQ of energizing module of nickel ECF transporter [Methanosarcina barkeri str. Wiesmoor]|uniref:Transmembrane component NikQ of energizing module of nickel ECF transporter n=1 Tax=Methanosarcina barkeri str. Wiesmoor TaxID=1434109 RepID=A0A0E3QMY1_METBA|nr:cobalt ECF transporter T component CbiQ [Methanosarcina barkeri]AKB51418.1 Transmembrane component NikQ of energizing module of nickel ECF transporter [Methanosarcina barkeri str. Wiesmoor]
MIPDWMTKTDTGPCRCSAVHHGKKGFIGKTIDGIFGFLEEAFVSDSFSKRDGFLQSLDPRAKLVSILTVIFAMSLIGDLRLLIFVYMLTLLFAYLSKIEILFFIKRVWLFIPIFAGIIAIPMIFNVFFPGDPLIRLVDLGSGAHLGPFSLPSSIYITKQGVNSAVIFTMRVATCVSAVVLLFLTTPQQVLFKSLRSVGVPKIYVFTLEMAYRYIFLLTDMVREIYIAKKARTIKTGGMFEEQKWVGGRIGYTLIRSLDTSEKVHAAMMSRGYNGDVKIMHDFKMRNRDYISGAIAVSMSVLLVLISHNIIR